MKINKIIIVGGGTAGYMTAATLLSEFPEKEITLIEPANLSIIGVGESTVAGGQGGFSGILQWLKMVDIKDEDFMPHTDAIYKHSIAFENWYRKDSGRFHYPFGRPYLEGSELALKDWHLKKLKYPDTPLSDYADCMYPGMALINQNKSMFTDTFSTTKGRDILQQDPYLHEVQLLSDYSYQFDAAKFGQWLRDKYCKARYPDRFTHFVGKVEAIRLRADGEGGIERLFLEGGQQVYGDLFIDCTGFRALLINTKMHVPFIPYNHILPNNKAWATRIPYTNPNKQIVNYTNCTAIENGWVWEIPLWSRLGAGYVFSDKFISEDSALKEFKHTLIKKGYKNVDELEYQLIPMKCGIHSKLWVKNVCAIGLSAAFIEPLQSNGLQSMHEFLFNLTRILERGHISQWDRDEFTTKCHTDFDRFVMGVSLPYALSHRDDTDYWKALQKKDWSSLLSYTKGELSGFLKEPFSKRHHDFNYGEYNNLTNCMAAGLNWNPLDGHTLKYKLGLSSLKAIKSRKDKLEARKRRWNKEVKNFPTPYEYVGKKFHGN